jgi:hypothetical protein
MKVKTKKLLCFIMVGFFALTGLWYMLFAPKEESYHEGENRNLAAAPQLRFSSFWDGTLSNALESWLLDRFFARDVAMDISMGIKDLGSIASYEDALVIMGREDDALTDNDLDEDLLEDMANDLLNPTVPPNTDPVGTTPDGEDPPETQPKLSAEDYPELLAIKGSSGGKVTILKRHRRTYALALTSVLNRVAALLPEDGQLMFTMVPQSNVANTFLATEEREYFTSEAEGMIDTFSADNVHAFSTAQILSDSLVRGDYVYFRSDMHWTPEGAYLVYCEMVKAAGLTPTPWEEFHIETEENFLGTYYRDNPSNYMKNNPDTLTLVTPDYPVEFRRITGKDTYKVIPLLDMNAKQSDRFSIYLGGSAGPWSYTVSDNGKTENCLVITDSFGLPFVPMVATNYGQVHYLDTRYYSKSTVGYTVADMMEKYNITDVYVIVGDLHSYGSSFITYDLPDQLGD